MRQFSRLISNAEPLGLANIVMCGRKYSKIASKPYMMRAPTDGLAIRCCAYAS